MLITLMPKIYELNVKMLSRGNSTSRSSAFDNRPMAGGGSISGRVLENGLPVSRRVMLYVRETGAYAGQGRSDSNGNYTFPRTNKDLTYFIVSVDDNNDGTQYNLVGQDLISGNHDERMAT